MKIVNHSLSLDFSEKSTDVELHSKIFPQASLRGQFKILCRQGAREHKLMGASISIAKIEHPENMETCFGTLNIRNLIIDSALQDVAVNIRLGVQEDGSQAFIQIEISNNSSEPIFIERIWPLIIKDGFLNLGPLPAENVSFYSNGWQSWSSTGTYHPGDSQHTSLLGAFQNPQIINPGTSQPKDSKHFSGDMFGVLCDHDNHVGLSVGFISQKNHFGSLEAALDPALGLKVWANGDDTRLDPGQKIKTDWLSIEFIDLQKLDPLNPYLRTVAEEHHIHLVHPAPVGWCSWYHFYQDITEEDIEANLTSLIEMQNQIPLSLLQIDDGYERFPGDWFNFVADFPKGIKPIAEKITNAGLTPGIWLAPFIVHPKADLVKDHPEWLLRDEQGKLVSAGFVWNHFNYALDITNPEALAYACQVIQTAVRDWGFKYLKLDFLYAAALEGQYQDPTRTRAEVLRFGLKALREAAGPDIFMLACGCPLGSALGIFDAMRISADISGHWEPNFPPVSSLIKKEVNMPSARNALQNILSRAMLHNHWWINDPDCLLIRPDTELTIDEVQCLATAIALTGGSLLVSDDLPGLPQERLRIAQTLLPLMDQRAFILDLFQDHTPNTVRLDLENSLGMWHLLAVFNWHDQPASLDFSPKKFRLPQDRIFWWREFWSGQIGKMTAQSPVTFYDIPPHGVRVLAVRPYQGDKPTYLGGNVHISQGLEISQWHHEDQTLTFHFKLGRQANGKLFFYLPWQPIGCWEGKKSHQMHSEGQTIFSLELRALNNKTFQIKG